MSAGYFDKAVRLSFGQVAAGAAIEVRHTGGGLADIYSNAAMTAPLSNPGVLGDDGRYEFYALFGVYNITVGAGASAATYRFKLDGDGVNFLTRADFVSAVADGYAPTGGTVVTIGGLSWMVIPDGHADYGTDPISDLPGWMPVGDVYPGHYGAVGDGVTDDGDALRAWAANGGGKTLRILDGAEYLGIVDSASERLEFQENCAIKGKGKIILKNTSAIYMEFVSVQKSNITFDGTQFVGDIFAGSSGFFFLLGDNATPPANVSFIGGSVDLQNSISGATGVHSVHGFSFERSFTDHTWDNWTFTRCNYATIKTNTATSTQERVTIRNCLFKNNVRGNLTGFNSPSGELKNVVIEGNHFIRETAYFIDIQDQTLMGGVVACEGMTFTGNTGYGYGRDVIHCEELTGPVAVTGNSWVHLGGGEDGGITFRSNAVGGGVVSAEHITVSGNSGKVDGTADAGSAGIWFVWDGDGEPGGKHISVTGNMIYGYETGIDVGDAELGSVAANYITGSTYGIHALYPSQAIHGNTIEGATVGLVHEYTGIWGRNIFIDCVDLFAAGGSESKVMSVGWDVMLKDRILPNGSTNLAFNLTVMPTEMVGWIDYVMRNTAASQSHYSADISATGGTLGTVTRRLRASSGNPFISSVDANIITTNAGNIAVTAANSSGFDAEINIWASFTGSWMQ